MTALEVRWHQESPLILAKASPNNEFNAFVGHGAADISARTLPADLSSSFAAATRTSLRRLARIALSSFRSASSGAGQKFFFVSVRERNPLGLLEPASSCAQSLLRWSYPFSNLVRRLLSEPQRFQAFGLGAFGFALRFVLGHCFGAFGGSLFFFELHFRPFPLFGVVGQRSLLLPLEIAFIQESLPVFEGVRVIRVSQPAPPRGARL
jgi:hypothetical protein